LTLLTLSAGANTELFDSAALGRGQVTINVNGQRPTNNNFQLEGVNANDVNLPVLDNVPLPNPDTIQEFKTQTFTLRRVVGPQRRRQRPGQSEERHGPLSWRCLRVLPQQRPECQRFLLNAATPQVARPVLRQNQYGGSFGGPVPKSKTFFFFVNYQGTREASGISAGTVLNSQIPVLPREPGRGHVGGPGFCQRAFRLHRLTRRPAS